MIVEAEMFYHLPSTNWRIRKASHIIQLESEAPENPGEPMK
jgi:hypothetical protein